MKQSKRWISVLLVMVLLLALLPGTALATERETHEAEYPTQPELRDTEAILLEDESDLPDGIILAVDPPMQTAADGEGVSECEVLLYYCSVIRSQLLAGNTGSFNIDLAGLSLTTDNEQFRHIGYYCPYFDYENIKAYLYYYSGGRYAYLRITNNLSAEETIAWVNLVDAKLAELSALVEDDSLSVADQVLILHDYMDANYHYINPIPSDTYKYYYPGVMAVEGTGVCQSYSYLLQYVLNRKGVECYTVTSDTMNHAWNLVGIDGEYYHVDITWDDPIYDRYGQAKHNYLLLSDTAIADDSHNHSGWDLTGYICDDTRYEDAYWLSATSPVVLMGSDRYYVTGQGLTRYATQSGTTTLLDSNMRWYVYGQPLAYYPNTVFSGLFAYGGKLYYNSYRSVRSYSPETGAIQETAVDVTDGYIFGLTHDGCTLTYELAEDYGVNYPNKDLRTLSVHDYAEVKTEAGCTTAGGLKEVCSLCGDVKSSISYPATGHSAEIQNAVAATCGQDGYTGNLVCTACGETVETGSVIPATGQHVWDAGTVTKEPTESEEGIRTYTCGVCSESKTEPIEKLTPAEPGVPVSTAGLSRSGTRKLTAVGQLADFASLDTSAITGHGLVYMTATRLGSRELTVDTSGRTKVSFSAYKADGSFTYTFTPASKSTVYVIRAWISMKDDNGNTVYYYSDPVTASYNSCT